MYRILCKSGKLQNDNVLKFSAFRAALSSSGFLFPVMLRVAVCFFIFPVFMAQGLSFLPLEQKFYPSQSGGRIKTFRISNTQTEQIAVRIRIMTRNLSEDGEELRGDAEGDFLVFPSNISLPPGGSQAVRVQWLGSEVLEQEIAYRIIAEQIPVSFTDEERTEGSNINMLFRYIGSIYIVPPEGEPDVVISELNRKLEGDELKGLSIRLENKGTVHGIVKTPEITLVHFNEQTGLEETLVLNQENLPSFADINLLAGSSLNELVTIPMHWKVGAINASINFDLVQ